MGNATTFGRTAALLALFATPVVANAAVPEAALAAHVPQLDAEHYPRRAVSETSADGRLEHEPAPTRVADSCIRERQAAPTERPDGHDGMAPVAAERAVYAMVYLLSAAGIAPPVPEVRARGPPLDASAFDRASRPLAASARDQGLLGDPARNPRPVRTRFVLLPTFAAANVTPDRAHDRTGGVSCRRADGPFAIDAAYVPRFSERAHFCRHARIPARSAASHPHAMIGDRSAPRGVHAYRPLSSRAHPPLLRLSASFRGTSA